MLLFIDLRNTKLLGLENVSPVIMHIFGLFVTKIVAKRYHLVNYVTEVVFLLQKGTKTNFSYVDSSIPISLTSIMLKTMESCVE